MILTAYNFIFHIIFMSLLQFLFDYKDISLIKIISITFDSIKFTMKLNKLNILMLNTLK